MPHQHLLLTGAGFSCNWNGMSVADIFDHLIGCPELDQVTRQLLFKYRDGGGFENALTELQTTYADVPTIANSHRMAHLQSALHSVFELMGQNFAGQEFEFQDDVAYQVAPFLGRFDAFFTINQDTLIETHYNGGRRRHGGWSSIQIPGMIACAATDHVGTAMEARLMPDKVYTVLPNLQPYFKLHGSINWRANGHVGHMMILGGAKEAQIGRHEVLRKYREEFDTRLSQPGARLMVIGYGFNDQHINNAIARGVRNGLKIFIVDLLGTKAFDVCPHRPSSFTELLQTAVIGVSKRTLKETFNTNHAEHGRLMKFFEATHL